MRQIVRNPRLKGLKVVVKSNGKVYKYRRINGRLARLPNLPENHPDFLSAWVAAEAQSAPRAPRSAPGTLGALWEVIAGSEA